VKTAREFLSIDVSQLQAERDRVARLLAELSTAPLELRQKLTSEFLQIVATPAEKLVTRTQAASILGFSAHALGISGSDIVAQQLSQVLRSEFLSEDLHSRPKIENMHRFFLRALVSSVFIVSPRFGLEIAQDVSSLCADSDDAKWLGKLVEAASRKLG
jgi:hypothetical protein